MSMVLNTNTLSLVAQNNLNTAQSKLSTAIQALSSGLKINSAKDNAAGQAIANRLTSQINGLTQATTNANDGISVAQTTEGALDEINTNLQNIRQLTVQAQNGTNSSSDLKSIQDEITASLAEIDRVSSQTQFNGTSVLGSNTTMSIQVGANDGQTISINLQKTNSSTLGMSGFSVGGNSLKVGDALTTVAVAATATTAPATVDLSNAASQLSTATKTTITGSDISLHSLLDSNGDPTDQYVVQSGSDYYAASVGADGKVAINTSDVSFDDVANGITTAATQTASLVKVAADSNGNATGYVTIEGKNYTAGTNGTDVLANTGTGTAAGAASAATGGTAATVIHLSGDSSTTATSTFSGASSSNALATIDAAIAKVDTFRSSLGAVQNRFDSAITNLNNTVTNLSSAQSRIQDADYATEVSAMSKAQILQQAGTSVLAQANKSSQSILTLLQ